MSDKGVWRGTGGRQRKEEREEEGERRRERKRERERENGRGRCKPPQLPASLSPFLPAALRPEGVAEDQTPIPPPRRKRKKKLQKNPSLENLEVRGRERTGREDGERREGRGKREGGRGEGGEGRGERGEGRGERGRREERESGNGRTGRGRGRRAREMRDASFVVQQAALSMLLCACICICVQRTSTFPVVGGAKVWIV